MTYAERRNLALAVLAAFIAIILLSACGTSHHALPPYEPPLAKTDFQHVRTQRIRTRRRTTGHTAITTRWAESCTRQAHRSIEPKLKARAIPAYEVPRALPVDETASFSPQLQPFSMEETRTVRRTTKRGAKTTRSVKRAVVVSKPRIGSAAADWSRWPVGTTFRLLSTSQTYRVEDYGWALVAATRLIFTCQISAK